MLANWENLGKVVYFNFFMYLFLYRLFMEILNSCVDCDEIQFKEDCNWAPMRFKKVVQEVSASSNGIEGITTKTVIFVMSYGENRQLCLSPVVKMEHTCVVQY